MRKHLVTAIEVASLISAVGVVISAITYSLIFYKFDLNYLALATVSDIIRDSFRTLILLASVAILILPIVVILRGRIENYADWKLALFSLTWTTANFTTLILGMYVALSVVTPAKPNDPMSWKASAIFFLVIGIISLAIFSLGRWARSERRDTLPERPLPPYGPIALLAFALSTYGLIFAANAMARQIEEGIPITVHPHDKTLCGGSYSISWLGESRMVVRCKKDGAFVVHVNS